MIADIAARYLEELGWRWRLKDGSTTQPTAEDVEKALDEAARLLYTSGDDQVQMGHLLIMRTPSGTFDVYVHIGETK